MQPMYFPCHEYQREACQREGARDILNVACKEDPANLGRDFNATNVDIQDYDPEMQVSLYQVPNFVRGDARNLEFPDERFNTVVLGELLEHLSQEVAIQVLREAARVLTPNGQIVVTMPQDARPPEHQRPPHELYEYTEGIASWHRFVPDEELWESVRSSNLRVAQQRRLRYDLLTWLGKTGTGWGLILQKASS